MTDASDDALTAARTFFDHYATALLARDEKAIAGMYAVPSLIVFPDRSTVVSDSSQTEDFFRASWSQYEGVEEADAHIVLMGRTASSLWVDVTWSYDGAERERFCYQLIAGSNGHQIAVLTLMT